MAKFSVSKNHYVLDAWQPGLIIELNTPIIDLILVINNGERV